MQSNTAMPNIQEPDIIDVVGVFVRNKWRGCAIVCVVVLIGVVMNFVFPASYEAVEIIRIASVGGQPVETFSTLKVIFGTDVVASEIATTLRLSTRGTYERYIIEEAGKDSGDKSLVRVRGRGATPEEAKAVAELVVQKIFVRLQSAAQSTQDILQCEVENLRHEKDRIEREAVRSENLVKHFSGEMISYQSEIIKRADAQSEAQGRIMEAYTRLFTEANSRSDALQREIERLKQRSVVIQADILRKQADIEHMTSRVEIDAMLPNRAFIPPHLIQNVIYSVVLGIFLAIVWILVREYHVERKLR